MSKDMCAALASEYNSTWNKIPIGVKNKMPKGKQDVTKPSTCSKKPSHKHRNIAKAWNIDTLNDTLSDASTKYSTITIE